MCFVAGCFLAGQCFSDNFCRNHGLIWNRLYTVRQDGLLESVLRQLRQERQKMPAVHHTQQAVMPVVTVLV